MKRLTALIIILAMVLCLGACGGKTDDATQTDALEEVEEIDEEEIEEDSNAAEYTLEYLQSGPLILASGNHGDGAFDASGKLVIPCKYDELCYIGKGRYLTSRMDENVDWIYGIVDLEGNEILPCEYEMIEPISEKYDVYDFGQFYFLNGYKEPEGEFIKLRKVGSNADEYISIIDGRSVSRPDKSMMLTFDENAMDDAFSQRAETIPVPEEISNKYKEASDIWGILYGTNESGYYNGRQYHYYTVMFADGVFGIVDANGRELGNGARWNDVGFEYANGLIAVQKEDGGLWALIDSEGNEVTDYIFDVLLDNA